MLRNAGPIRGDGSDKFFGMENVRLVNRRCGPVELTWTMSVWEYVVRPRRDMPALAGLTVDSYCNSILQCLYYSVPFREHVLAYPRRSSAEIVAAAAATAPPRPPFNAQANGAAKKPAPPVSTRNASGPPPPPQKPEDKDSPEYKKKQALIAGPILNMSYQNAASYDMPESLFTSLKDIFEAVVLSQSRSGVISPSKFLEVLRKENEMFRSAMHQDAHEFLNLLLNAVVENIEVHERTLAVRRREEEKLEDSAPMTKTVSGATTVSFPSVLPAAPSSAPTRWLHELFEGTLTSETRCLTCENVSQRDEPFLDLSVDLEQHSSVTACLRRFSEEEMLCERNKFHCDNCGGLQEAEKRMKIKRLPRILALHLKRFKYTEDLQRLQKLFHKVVYPYHLRLFNTTDDAEDPDRLYELYAVVVHIGGGPYHGHYVAIIKTQDRGWLLFDDEMVEPVDEGFVRNFFGDRPGLACAYVLFYQQTTVETVRKEQRMKGRRRASQDLTTGLGLHTKLSAELHLVQTVSPALSPGEGAHLVGLDHAITAPQFKANGHVEIPQSPPAATTGERTSPVITPPLQSAPVQSKKEKAKEDKVRKAAEKLAEKERHEAERQKRKDLAAKLHEAHKKQEADLKAALEASKLSKAEEDHRRALEKGDKGHGHFSNGTSPLGLDRFRRTKSLRFGSLTRKDKPLATTTTTPTNTTNTTTTTSEETLSSVVTDDNTPEKDKERRNRFSIRKRSFGMLS